MIVALDGIIGAGKSTILEELQKRGEQVYLEPFQENPLLPAFYRDIKRFAGITQCVFFPLRADLMLSIPSNGVSFIERSAYSDRFCFGELLRDQMEPEEWEGYLVFFDLFTRKFNLQPDLSIIIDDPPEVSLERIKIRGREMEKEITLDYLQTLRDQHCLNADKLGRQFRILSSGLLTKSVEERADLIQKITTNARTES